MLTIGSTLMGDQGAEMGKAKQCLERLTAFTENIFPQVCAGLSPTSSSDIGVGAWQKKKKKKWINRADQTHRLKKGSIGFGNRMIQNEVFLVKEKAMEKLMTR